MMADDDGAASPTTAIDLARILQFGDSMLPIGGFAFSGGLESAIQQRVVTDADTLKAFARTAMEQAARGDGIALVCAHRAARAGDVDEVVRIDKTIYARKLSGEMRTMSVRMSDKPKPDAEQAMRDWWRTSIIEMKPGVIRYRGYPIEEMIGRVSFAQMIWLMTPVTTNVFIEFQQRQSAGVIGIVQFPFLGCELTRRARGGRRS